MEDASGSARPNPSRFPAWGLSAVWASLIVLLALGHYTTHGAGHGDPNLLSHTLLRRLSYLPIGLLAVQHGWRGGLLAAACVSLLYAPHAFFADALSAALGVHLHADPSPLVEKATEVVVYLALGAGVGLASDRARRRERALAEATDDLERTTEELRRAERLSALGEMAAGIAHEVRNPLAALRTSAELLAEAYPEGHARHRVAELHLSELDRLDGVVDRFLRFARPTPPSLGPVDVETLLRRCHELVEAAAKPASVRLSWEAPLAPAQVLGDEDLLLQVLLNLGLNAVQASPVGGTVRLTAQVEEARVRLLVDDEGPGVDPALGDTVYDPCVGSRDGGSGLGLAVASRLVDAHGGRLGHQIREPVGTRFFVELRRHRGGGT